MRASEERTRERPKVRGTGSAGPNTGWRDQNIYITHPGVSPKSVEEAVCEVECWKTNKKYTFGSEECVIRIGDSG